MVTLLKRLITWISCAEQRVSVRSLGKNAGLYIIIILLPKRDLRPSIQLTKLRKRDYLDSGGIFKQGLKG